MGRQVFCPGQQQTSGLFLGWWEASCCLLSRFSSTALRCGPGRTLPRPGRKLQAPQTHCLRPETLPIQVPLHPDPPHRDHPHLGPSITPAIPIQDHPSLDPPSPLPTPPELLLVSAVKMCQTHAMRGSPKTPPESGTYKNRLPDPREEAYQI